MGFPRQEYWSGLLFPSLRDLPDPGIKPVSPSLAGGFFTTEPPEKSSLDIQFSSVAQSCLTLCRSGLQHARRPCPSLTPRVYSNSFPLSWRYHKTISSSVVPFSSSLQSFPASESFHMSQFLASGGQSIGVSASASVLPIFRTSFL